MRPGGLGAGTDNICANPPRPLEERQLVVASHWPSLKLDDARKIVLNPIPYIPESHHEPKEWGGAEFAEVIKHVWSGKAPAGGVHTVQCSTVFLQLCHRGRVQQQKWQTEVVLSLFNTVPHVSITNKALRLPVKAHAVLSEVLFVIYFILPSI